METIRWPPPALLLPASTGLLLALAFPPLHLVVPSFVALVPLAVHLDRAGERAGRREARRSRTGPYRAAFGAGVVAGAVAWGLLLAWIPVALLSWSWLAVPLYVLAVAVLAGLTGLVAAAVHGLRFAAGLPLALALPLAWTAGEWLRAHFPGSLAFPWLGLGTSLTGHPEWLGIAEVVGARGVTFWLAAVSGLGAWGWRIRERARGHPVDAGSRWRAVLPPPRGLLALGSALALAVVVPAWGVMRAEDLETRPVARVAVVQPNVTRRTHEDPDALRRDVYAALDRLVPEVEASGADLVVLPEALVPDTLGTAGGREAEARLVELARRVGAPVLVGMLTVSGEGPSDGSAIHNSVVLVDGEGRRPWRYDKHHLVPVVERVPLLPLPGVAEGLAGYAPGRAWPVARIGPSLAVGAFVCYESAFPGVSRKLITGGAHLLANVTNDGWFGGPGRRTHALWQHPAHLVLRAVETRTGVVRAASTGISLFVDPAGRIQARTPLFEEAVAVAAVRSAEGDTIFVRFGDVTGAVSVGATVLLLLAARLRGRRHIGGADG